MHIAYLLNQYPYASCTFIRREIVELEKLGLRVSRMSIRPTEHSLVDAEDQAEVAKTRYILGKGGLGRMLMSTLAVKLAHPVRYLRAFLLAMKLARRSDRGYLVHLAYLMEACVVLRWCRELNVERIHCHFATNPTAVAMLCGVMGGPAYSFTVHGPQEFDLAYALSLDEKISRAEFVATISSFARSQLYRWCRHRDWPKVKIVRCGVSEAFLRADEVPVPQEPRLLSIGRLSEQKGQLLLVQAAAMLHQEGMDFRLNVIGDGEMRGEIERYIASHGLGEKVVLLGWRSGADVLHELQRSRALVLSSFAEGLPVVIMEALALRRPVITTQIAGVPELVEHGKSGWLVPAGSVEALADAMREVLQAAPEQLDRMGRAGYRAVEEKHDAAQEARALAELMGQRDTGFQPVHEGSKHGLESRATVG